MSCRSLLVFVAVALPLVLTAHTPARGQEGGAPAPPPPDTTQAPEVKSETPPPAAPAETAPAALSADSLAVMLPELADVRVRADIANDLKDSRARRQGAENRLLAAREKEIRWKSQTDIKKSEIETLKKQIDVAKKEKRQGEQKDLEAARKKLELTRDFSEDVRQVYESEAVCQQSAFDYYQARIAAASAESLLAERWSSKDPATRLSAESRELETRVINAVKERADKMSAFATKEKTLSDKKKAALEGWAALNK
ncbi:MAG: hypothetical protein ACREOU_11085 [Candidatus Eiseniibacteriota bacterium]